VRPYIVVVVAACSSTDTPPRPDPLAPLPLPAPVETSRFRDAEACAQCHLVPDPATVLHDATGANVSPVLLWRSSLMALASRDPYYLATFAEELALAATDKRSAIAQSCTRCHGPAGNEELATTGAALTFDDLVAGSSPAAVLARGGVTCTACHQIAAANLGTESSFTGAFRIDYGRTLFGRYPDPLTNPMMLIVNYTPTLGSQIENAALCGTCHTVIVPSANGEVVEQATFLEWRSSSFMTLNQPCQQCHVPTVDANNTAISAPVASFPTTLGARSPIGRHVFVGGNSYMLSLLADAVEWSGAGISADELTASAARDDAHLATAAKLSVVNAHADAGGLAFAVRVENMTGHKLPTGYPSRRMWLHVVVTVGGQVAFESGGGEPGDQPHRDTISSPDQVQVWEAVLVDAQGNPTHRVLDARRYSKDDRILPAGYAPSSVDRPRTDPVGVVADPSFVGGRDEVSYTIPGIASNATIDVELLYEAIRPQIVDEVDMSAPTPAGVKFVDLARARPITPVVMAHISVPYVF
jgi:hypothetical protein